jgi:hypothetical protein
MLLRVVSLSIVTVGILLLSGCGAGKLEVSKTMALGANVEAMSIDLDAQSKPQTLYIEFTSNGGEVSVYVFKEEEARGEDGLATARGTKAIAKKTDSKGDNFTADIPANTATRVIVRCGGRTAEVKIRVTNQKT